MLPVCDASPEKELKLLLDVREAPPGSLQRERLLAIAEYVIPQSTPVFIEEEGKEKKEKSPVSVKRHQHERCPACGPLDLCDLVVKSTKSPAVTVLFPLEEEEEKEKTYVAVYTSKPWSLFATSTVAYDPTSCYGVYQRGNQRVIASVSCGLPESTFLGAVALDGRRVYSPWRRLSIPLSSVPGQVDGSKGTGFVHLCPLMEVCAVAPDDDALAFDANGLINGDSLEMLNSKAIAMTEHILTSNLTSQSLSFCIHCNAKTFPCHDEVDMVDGLVYSRAVRSSLSCPLDRGPHYVYLGSSKLARSFMASHEGWNVQDITVEPINVQRFSRSAFARLTRLQRLILLTCFPAINKGSLKAAAKLASQLEYDTSHPCVAFEYHEHLAAEMLSSVRELKRNGDVKACVKQLATFLSRKDTYLTPAWLALLLDGLVTFESSAPIAEPSKIDDDRVRLYKRACSIRRASSSALRAQRFSIQIGKDSLEDESLSLLPLPDPFVIVYVQTPKKPFVFAK